jgi:3D (Asp-Asp-Asp) domain-containing protein
MVDKKSLVMIGILAVLIPVNVILTYRNIKNWKDDHIANSGRLVEVWNVLPENENKRVTMTVTGYSSVEGCDETECIMANGRRAYVGAVACPRSWKLGTVVKFEGKEYECMDRLSMKYDNRIDVFFGYGNDAFKEARKFGKRSLEVEIVR